MKVSLILSFGLPCLQLPSAGLLDAGVYVFQAELCSAVPIFSGTEKGPGGQWQELV